MEKTLIALCGKAGSGKDTVGAFLAAHYGFRKFAFADLLKDVIGRKIFCLNSRQLWGGLKDVVDPRYGKTPREILQSAGMALRGCYEDVWILPLYSFVSCHERVVVTDARFINEIKAVKNLGGRVWLIERGKTGKISNPAHVSENEFLSWRDFDARISNDGSLRDLYEKVHRNVSDLAGWIPSRILESDDYLKKRQTRQIDLKFALIDRVTEIAEKHGLDRNALQGFIDGVLRRMILDSDALTDLLAPLGLGWKARAKKELELMEDLLPLFKILAHGKEISGLEVYDHA